MGELNERRWAVLSERGCEAAGLSYDEAADLMRNLTGEKVPSLYVVTNEAAGRLSRKGAIESETLARPSEAQTKI